MPVNVCKHCGCNEIDADPKRGDKVCTNCGAILEDQLIVSELQFQENANGRSTLVGRFMPTDGSKTYTIGGYLRRSFGQDSHAVTLQNAKRRIQTVAEAIRMNQHCQDLAFNYFKIVLKKNLTRGRKSEHVVASCLYIVSRQQGLPHMLLDFSDILQVNVYTLGKTFLQLSRELCLQMPIIDPSLYINRFAEKLQFGDRVNEVCSTALRLVQRMTRDWMHTGRRPSGLCGAALLVSARMHNFSRTVKEVIKVVKVCETTVRKRLCEFEDTPSSQLTIEEFHNIDLEEEQDPPCFTEGKKRSKLHQTEEEDSNLKSHLPEVVTLQHEIDQSLVRKPTGIFAAYAKMGDKSAKPPSSSEMAALTNFIEGETLKEVITPNEEGSPTEPSAQETIQGGEERAEAERNREEQERMKQGLPVHRLGPTAASLGIRDIVEECVTVSEGNEVGDELDMEGIDDDEIDKMLLSNDEVKIKTEIWMKENEDFLIAQKEKEERRLKEEQEQGIKPEKKKRKYKKREKVVEAASAKEAFAMVIQEKKLSRKINYDILEDLRVKEKKSTSSSVADSGLVATSSNASGSSQSILKPSSALKRSNQPGVIEDSEDEVVPVKRKCVQIQDPEPWREKEPDLEVSGSGLEGLELPGAVPYLEHEPEIAPEDEEEEEDDEEDEEDHLRAQALYHQKVSLEEEEQYYVDSD